LLRRRTGGASLKVAISLHPIYHLGRLPTGTDAVLTDEVQELIDRTIRQTGTDSGIGFGFLDREDVRSHVQEAAVAAMHRYDGSRGSVLSFLRPRLRGAAIDLIRSKGSRTRHRPERKSPGGAYRRPVEISIERELETDGLRPFARDWSSRADTAPHGPIREQSATGLADPLDAVAGVDELADLTLALWQLPTRLRLVLYLLFYEELTPLQAAARLDVTEETLRALRDAGLTKMRLALVRRVNGRA